MTDGIAQLARRRDRVIGIAKAALIAATCLWLVAMALYDDSVDRPGVARDYLLPSRSGVLLALFDIEPLSVRRVWGGPWTLYGMQCLAGSLGVVGLIALFRARMNRGRFSWPGLLLVIAALIVSAQSAASGSGGIYPATIDRDALGRLLSLVERREPGLLSRLRSGERLVLPATGGAAIGVRLGPDGHVVPALPPGRSLLRDRADAESLRFVLAEQALADGDRATLRRLLPIALAMPPTDQPARDDFARRLDAMGAVAGVAAAPPGDLPRLRAGAADWRTMTELTRVLRPLMQGLLLIGLVGTLIGFHLRRRVASIERRQAALIVRSVHLPPVPVTARGFGRRVTEA